ncbi:MAG: DUF3127 domain-containing protein [Prevotellaceae bacterium]|jgi:hypothetical protein|nr:DUF3127 domain-containing protein [Prevotellaceae bacterium]
MAFEISGKLVKKLDVQSGSSERGTWNRQDIIIEIPGQFPRQICLSLWGEQVIEAARYNIGDILKVNFDIQSREFNGKWYTSVRPWRMEVEAVSATAYPSAPAMATPVTDTPTAAPAAAPIDDPFNNNPQSQDDLPF